MKLEFSRKGDAVATVNVDFTASIKIDDHDLSADAVRYFIEYGIRQALGDSYAAAKSVDEAKALFAKRYDKAVKGIVAMRAVKSSVPIETQAQRNVIRDVLKGQGKWKDIAKAEDRDAQVDAIWAKNKDNAALIKAFNAELAELKRKMAAADLGGITIDL